MAEYLKYNVQNKMFIIITFWMNTSESGLWRRRKRIGEWQQLHPPGLARAPDARRTDEGRPAPDARGRRLSVETAMNVGRRLRRDQLLRRGGPYHRHVSN